MYKLVVINRGSKEPTGYAEPQSQASIRRGQDTHPTSMWRNRNLFLKCRFYPQCLFSHLQFTNSYFAVARRFPRRNLAFLKWYSRSHTDIHYTLLFSVIIIILTLLLMHTSSETRSTKILFTYSEIPTSTCT